MGCVRVSRRVTLYVYSINTIIYIYIYYIHTIHYSYMTTHEAIVENFQPRSTYQKSKGIKTSREQKGVKTKNNLPNSQISLVEIFILKK